MYDKQQDCLNYDECWHELINDKLYYLKVQDLYLGPQGATISVQLPTALQPWFSVPSSTLNVTLLVAKGYRACDLGQMIEKALKILKWHQTENMFLHVCC